MNNKEVKKSVRDIASLRSATEKINLNNGLVIEIDLSSSCAIIKCTGFSSAINKDVLDAVASCYDIEVECEHLSKYVKMKFDRDNSISVFSDTYRKVIAFYRTVLAAESVNIF